MRFAAAALYILSATATYWLWQNWSFSDQTYLMSSVLGLNTGLLIFILYDTCSFLVRTPSPHNFLKRWKFFVPMGVLAICTVVLAVDTFWWLRAYFLPLQITFIVVNCVLFAKRRGWIFKGAPSDSSSATENNSDTKAT